MVDNTEETYLERKIHKKSNKKRKNVEDAPKEVSKCSGEVPSTMEDCLRLIRKGDAEKDQKDVGVSKYTYLEKENNDGVIYYHPKGNKKKKKRKFEPLENDDKSCNGIQMQEEERLCLQRDDMNDLGIESEVKTRNIEKKRLKEDKCHSLSSQVQTFTVKDMNKFEIGHKKRSSGEDNVARKNRKKILEVCDSKEKKKSVAAKEIGEAAGKDNVDSAEKVQKRKKKNNKDKEVSCAVRQETPAMDLSIEGMDLGNEKHDMDTEKEKKPDSSATISNNQKTVRELEKVKLLSKVKVFPASDRAHKLKEKEEGDGLIRGKRFSPEEDEMIKQAVFNYIQVHDLGVEGLNMVLNCKSHSRIKNCWKDIAAAIPKRPYLSVYCRAHTLFERDTNRSWSAEELEHIKKFHEKHGPKWKDLADELGKHHRHLREAWRRTRLPKMKRGHWSQEEYHNLFDLVNTDLREKVSEEKKSKYGMLRDNISWSAISDKIGTRRDTICCMKWYRQLASPMVREGIWADIDDYRMLQTLYELDACCVEDLDWDNLLVHRPGDVCWRRWNQMCNHIGEHGCKSFADQVEVLTKRYCPDVLEAREIWDNKPVVS